MVIAIDGPAGAGKSTVARAVAERLGFTYLDTGAMYRAVALAAAERDAPPAQVAAELEIELGDRVLAGGRDVTEAIRTPEISAAASRVSADPGVRAALVRKQQELLRARRLGGRGPRRRHRRLPGRGGQGLPHRGARGARAAARGRARDRRRAASTASSPTATGATPSGAHGPLLPAADAVPVDTSALDLEGAIEQVLALVVEAREIEA